MAINGTIKLTRQSTSTNWHTLTDEVTTYLKANFIDTNKRTFGGESISEDGLIKTVTYTFADQTAKNDWVEDVTIQSMLNSRDTYNVANNIDLERTETES
ncbi:uncharacterized protein METZ01_LOCUS284814 [marine metagenome]|uniref:Uncharacterized protein n=1 Tax=marine metagenome TaxID=408172 RepID=A0A382L5L4_9ZZZZ